MASLVGWLGDIELRHPFSVPSDRLLPERLGAVLAVIYRLS